MSNYDRRLTKLEEEQTSAPVVLDLIVIFVAPGGEATAARVLGGEAVKRLPGESKKEMIARARPNTVHVKI